MTEELPEKRQRTGDDNVVVWIRWDEGRAVKLVLPIRGDVDDLRKEIKKTLTPRLDNICIDEISVKRDGYEMESSDLVESSTAENPLHACHSKRLSILEEQLLKLEKENALNQDKRLIFFSKCVNGSNSRKSRGSSSNSGATNQSESNTDQVELKTAKDKMARAKKNIKSIFGDPMQCFMCGSETEVTIAHIVTSGEADYSVYGTSGGYRDDLDVHSIRNFVPLCGREGMRGTCHDAFDRYLVAIMYDPFQTKYFLLCADGAPEKLKEIAKNGTKLVSPEGWKPYHRLLAWRARKSAIDYCYSVDTTDFVNMNNMSEESNSVGDMDEDEDEDCYGNGRDMDEDGHDKT